MKKNIKFSLLVTLMGIIFLGGCALDKKQSDNNKKGLKVEKNAETIKKNISVKGNKIIQSDKPKVEVFVMSYCPFGTQFQKGIVPVMKLLKDKADIQIKFVDYVMHGQKEIDENINQYCIQKNEPDKYLSFLECFLKEGKSSQCLIASQVDQEVLKKCISETIKEFNLSGELKKGQRYPEFKIQAEENERYGVQGSPTLVINGKIVKNSRRDSASLLAVICSSFTEQPEECKEGLSSKAPSAGFGEDATSSPASGGCGN